MTKLDKKKKINHFKVKFEYTMMRSRLWIIDYEIKTLDWLGRMQICKYSSTLSHKDNQVENNTHTI